ncbi:DUF2797 domain-containing protein [Halobacteriales archaeon QS_3_64_16]|nr:MAG: DUF2797 domain-containing protein [Halobacteriales archaeon QS_3_64_16]
MQIAGYHTGPDDPALLVATEGSVEHVALEPGAELSSPLGDRYCAGTIDDGAHYPCDRPGTPYCERHTRDWAPTYAEEEYAVYLAAFAPTTFKVGITRSWRLDTRLREQGADRAAHIHTAASGEIAREVEREIAAEMPEAVRVERKVASLAATVDSEAWDALLDEHAPIERFDFDYGLALKERPVAETIATGTVVGTKGRLLILEHAGTTYATDLRDLVGFEIAAEATRDHQASLGAF